MVRGFTLAEVLTVLVVVGALTALTLVPLRRLVDRLAVHRATSEVASFYTSARHMALFTGRRVRIGFSADSLVALRDGVGDSVRIRRPGPARHGVTLQASRTWLTMQPTGIAWGAGNTTIVLRRGVAAESLTTSRLGRLKRW